MLPMPPIPPEILAEIFVFYAHDQFQPPTRLLYVSRRWRNIILSSPPCWSALSIPCSSNPTSPMNAIILSWIHRSGASPLFISLDLQGVDHQPVPLLDLSSPLLEQRNRFRELTMYNVSEWNVSNLTHLWPAPNLLSFSIADDQGSSFKPPLELVNFPLFHRNDFQAPRLSTLELSHCQFNAPRSRELHSIQELSLVYCTCSVMGFRQTLKCMPNLQRLKLGPLAVTADPFTVMVMGTGTATSGPEFSSLTLGHIWSMKLHFEQASTLILRNLHTPSLTHLTLAATVTNPSLITILAFLAQEELPLTYLGLTLIGSYSLHGLALILPTLPRMETLHVCVRHVSFHPLSVKNHPALTAFKIQFEPPPKSTRHWEELFDDQPEYHVTGRLFPDRALIEGSRTAQIMCTEVQQ